MKNVWNKILLIGLLVTSIACSDDESEPDPIIGTWILDDVVLTNAPTGYESWEDFELDNLYGETEYEISFFGDFVFEREFEGLQLTTGGKVEDEGTYEIEDDFLVLDPEDEIGGLNYEFEIEEDITDRELVLSVDGSYDLMADATTDTITSEEVFDSLFTIYAQPIPFKLLLYFDKD